MTRKERAHLTIDGLSKVIARPESELEFRDEYQLIVAVILSAQCTDARVNMVTPDVFAAWPTFDAMARAGWEDVAQVIASISYPNNKARHLVRMSQRIVQDFGGRLPKSQELLMKLPGVGRKTAQVVSSVAFNDQDALPVDTHVFRVANRIGLVKNADTPLKVELGLKRVVPRGSWGLAHHLLILHGRYTCTARRPACETCVVSSICEYNAARLRLPPPITGLNPQRGAYYCGTRKRYFDTPATRTDRTGTMQTVCPRCGSFNVYVSKTGQSTKVVRDFRVDGIRRKGA